jgi:hypothetical protein
VTLQPPAWVADAVFYQIFPDRFAASEWVVKPGSLEAWDSPPTVSGFKGGDLLGVVERLDYLVEFGVTAIYFNPIFQSASNHRYHTYDYLAVEATAAAYVREGRDSSEASIVVAINAGEEPASLRLRLPEFEGRRLTSVRWAGWPADSSTASGAGSGDRVIGGGVDVTIPARDALVLEVEPA